MWWKAYRDYPPDKPLVDQKVEPGKGIVGCEMHDLNGWGEEFHRPVRRSKPWMETLWSLLFGIQVRNPEDK